MPDLLLTEKIDEPRKETTEKKSEYNKLMKKSETCGT